MNEELKKELEILGKSIDEKIEAANKGLTEGVAKSEDVESLKTEIKADLTPLMEKFTALQAQLDTAETDLKKLRENKTTKGETFESALLKSMEANRENIEKYFEGVSSKGREINIGEFKTKADMTSADLTDDTSNYIHIEPPHRVPGIVYDPDRAEHMRDIIPMGTCLGNAVTYPQESGYTDGSGVTTENNDYGETSFTIEQKTALVESITAYATFSEIMVDDFPALASYMNARMPSKLLIEEDDQVLNGTGSVDGLLTVAAEFAAGGETVSKPNNFDALVFALSQVRVSEYKGNFIVMHPNDIRDMKLTKDANEDYIFPWVKVLNGKADVDGVPIFETTAMTAGTYLVGDFKLGCQLFQRKGIQLKIHDCDQDGTVIKGMKTATITERLALATYRTSAFVYDTFAASITELEEVVG